MDRRNQVVFVLALLISVVFCVRTVQREAERERDARTARELQLRLEVLSHERYLEKQYIRDLETRLKAYEELYPLPESQKRIREDAIRRGLIIPGGVD